MPAPRLAWRRLSNGGLAALGVAALVVGALAALERARPPARRQLTLSAERPGSTRSVMAERLVAAAAPLGIEVQLVPTAGHDDALDEVESGALDAALVPGALRLGHRPHVRQLTALYLEPLHLLAKEEIAGAVAGNLGALRGKVVSLGTTETATFHLASAVMEFAGLAPSTFVARALSRDELAAVAERAGRDELPDAVFLLATLPSSHVEELVKVHGYRVVPLPFAEAFALGALSEAAPREQDADPGAAVRREYVHDAVIPAFTYGVEPAVPPAPVQTLGARLLLVARDSVDPALVERLLDAVFKSRFAKITQPHLHPSLLALPPEMPLHPGAVAYARRDQPLITGDVVDELSNTLSIGGAVLGALIFFREWSRGRRRLQRDELFQAYILRVAAVERRAAQLEVGATLELEPLLELQQELVQIKGEALDVFAESGLQASELVSDFLHHTNDARDYLARLILHVRENLEETAGAQGRSAQALWNEEVAKTGPAGEES